MLYCVDRWNGRWLSLIGSVQSLDRLSHRGDMREAVFSAGGPCEQFWQGQGCPIFDFVHPAFPLPTTASHTLQGAMKDGFGEAVVACEMLEPCKFPSLDSCIKRFMRTHKEVDLAPHPVAGLFVHVGDAEKFSHAFGFEMPVSFLLFFLLFFRI